ncbi:outer membrane protein [Terrarubrum flagellatum]|uniref:outer membrane protein n=1 Tax=Terrirubrum flagellatum TaxID=2895980 RepID=UPI00314555E6
MYLSGMIFQRPIRRLFLTAASLAALGAAPAAAGSASAPWSDWSPFGISQPKWDGQYLAISSGLEIVSHTRGRTYGGPTIGVEGGKMWREGDFVYGVVGSLNYMKPFALSGSTSPYGEYSRDFAGAAKVKFGYLVQPNVLLYSTVGAIAQNEYWRMPASLGGRTDQNFAVRPQVGAGFEWAINDTTRIFGEITATAPVR